MTPFAIRPIRRPLALGIATATLAVPDASAVTIAEWTFETTPPALNNSATFGPYNANVGTGAASGVHASANTDWSNPAGNGSAESFNSNEWAIGDYYQFSLSSAGFEEIVFSWNQTRSSSGPALFDLAYSIDGTNFTVALNDYAISPIDWSASAANFNSGSVFSFNFDSIPAVANAATVAFRLVAAAAPTGATPTSGTNRVDNIIVTGSTLVLSQFWDVNGATGGIGGTGTWNTTTANFSTDETGASATIPFDGSKRVRFGGTTGTVTIDAAGVTAAGGLQFDAPAYTLTGPGTLTLTATPTVRALADATISATIAGDAGIIKAGGGTLILGNAGANTFTGAVTINGGVLSIARDNLLGNAANDITLSTGTLRVTGTTTLGGSRDLSGSGALEIGIGQTLTTEGSVNLSNVAISNGSPDHAAASSFVLNGSANSFGSLTVNDPIAITAPLGLTISNAFTTGATLAAPATINAEIALGTLTRITVVDTATANPNPHVDLTINGALLGTGRLHKLGGGTLQIINSTASTFDGGLRMGTSANVPEAGGRVVIGSPLALGNGQLQINDGILESTAAIAVAGTSGVSVGAGQLGPAVFRGSDFSFGGGLTIFSGATTGFLNRLKLDSNVTFAGGLNNPTGNSTGLQIEGVGTLRLNAPLNTLDKPITVAGGKLIIAGSLSAAAAPITVTANGQLSAGTDIASDLAALTITSGTLSPGVPGTDATGLINAPSLTLGAGSKLALDLVTATEGAHDRLTIANTVAVGGDLLLSVLTGASLAANDLLFVIVNNGSNPVTGTFNGFVNDPLNPSSINVGGYTFALTYQGDFVNATFDGGNDVALRVTAIPEPGSFGLLGAAGLLLSLRRRRT